MARFLTGIIVGGGQLARRIGINLPAPVFTVQPSIAGSPVVGSVLTGAPGVATSALSLTLAWLRNGTAIAGANGATYLVQPADVGAQISLQATAVGLGGSTAASSSAVTGTSSVSPSPGGLPAAYAQGMGATAADGLVAQLPLAQDGVARRMFVNPAIGSDSYNGLSPYPGYRANGAGPFWQYGASGQGVADSSYGPKSTAVSAVLALPALNLATDAGVGHQVLLAEGQTHQDGTASAWGTPRPAASHYGQSVAHPFVWESYSPSDPWNETRMGRATGSSRANIQASTDGGWNFKSDVNNSHGAISNFAFRGLRFTAVDGTRNAPSQIAFNWQSMDGDNILVENCDMASFAIVFNNTSNGVAGFARWSHNLIIRRCLFDHWQGPGTLFGAIHYGGWVGTYVEYCAFNHCTWADTPEGRYVADSATTKKPSIFTHDLYLAGSSQSPNVIRGNISLDAAATFLSNRNNAYAYNNVVIDAPISGGAGGGVSSLSLEQPNGNYLDAHHNLTIGGGFIDGPVIQFTGQPAQGSYMMAGGVVFEFGTATQPGHVSVPIGADLPTTVANAVQALNAQTAALISRVTYRSSTLGSTGQEIRQTPKTTSQPLVEVSAGGQGMQAPDTLYRGQPFGMTNCLAGSAVRDSLSINSGFMDTSQNMLPSLATPVGHGVGGISCVATFLRNTFYAWSTNQESFAAPDSGTTVSYSGNSYNLTSPLTTDQIYQALGYSSKESLRAAIIANPEASWGLTVLGKIGSLFGFGFSVPAAAPPTLTPQAPSTTAPAVGVQVTFSDPIVSGGTIVAATTYVDNVPVAGTGVGARSYTPASADQGKRLSRMVVVASSSGGEPATSLVELTALVAAAPTAPAAVTVDPIVVRAGNSFIFTARRTTNLSNAETHTVTVGPSKNYSPAAVATDFAGGSFPSVSITFPAGAATTPFTINSPTAIPE